MPDVITHEFGHAYAEIVGRLSDLPRLFYATHQRLADRRYHSQHYPPIPGMLLATLVLDGAIVWWHGRERRILRRGELWLGRYREEGTAYGFDPREAPHYEFLGVIFAGAIAEQMVSRLVAAYGHVFALDPGHPAVLRCLDVAHERSHRVVQGASRSAGLITDLLLAAGESAESGDADRARPATAQRIEAELRAAAGGSLDFSGLCRRLGLSRSHASRAFRAAYGTSPLRYHQDLRIALLCRLLGSGSESLAELARRTGFASAFALHRAFVRSVGMTPGRYRAGQQGAAAAVNARAATSGRRSRGSGSSPRA